MRHGLKVERVELIAVERTALLESVACVTRFSVPPCALLRGRLGSASGSAPQEAGEDGPGAPLAVAWEVSAVVEEGGTSLVPRARVEDVLVEVVHW